ncbi:MAG TPA: hypothetical protein VNK89_04810 [Thermoflexus sp.]|nr:hypothetical protein [Thermoflexus sp.]
MWKDIIGWILLLGLLAFIFAAPQNLPQDRPVMAGSVLLVMMHALVFWDERNVRYRLPFRLPSETMLVLPIGLALFAATRIRWHSMEFIDWERLFFGFAPLVVYLGNYLREARWKKHQKAT